MLVLGWDFKRTKDEQDHKKVVDAQTFLNQIACEKLNPQLVPELKGKPQVKQQRHSDPKRAFKGRHLGGDLLSAPAKKA